MQEEAPANKFKGGQRTKRLILSWNQCKLTEKTCFEGPPVNLKEPCMIEHFWRLEGKGYKLQGMRNLACHNCEGV